MSDILEQPKTEVLLSADDPWLVERTERIRLRGQRIASDIAAIGLDLVEVREHLPHGAWLPWLEREFGWSDRTARRFMDVAQAFKLDTVSDLQIDTSALYTLAAPKVAPTVRTAAIDRAKAGEHITVKEARRMVEDARAEVASTLDDAIRVAVNEARAGLEQEIKRLEGEVSAAADGAAEKPATKKLRIQLDALRAQLNAPPDVEGIIASIARFIGVPTLDDVQMRRLASTLGLAITVRQNGRSRRYEPVTPEESAAIQGQLATSARVADGISALAGAPQAADMCTIASAIHRNQARKQLPGISAWITDYLAVLGPDMEDPRDD